MVINPIWVKKSLTALVLMFDRVGLQTNLGKTKAMVCTPGFIWVHKVESLYKRWEMGDVAKFMERDQTRVSYEICGAMIAA